MDSDIDYLILIPGARNGYDQVLLEARQRECTVILAEQDVEMEPEYDREDYILGYVARTITRRESFARISWPVISVLSPAIPWLFRGKSPRPWIGNGIWDLCTV